MVRCIEIEYENPSVGSMIALVVASLDSKMHSINMFNFWLTEKRLPTILD
jgi:hypothetical protein